MSAKKLGLLILILGAGAALETAWGLRGEVRLGPEGCRVIGGRFYGPSYSFEQATERELGSAEGPRLEVRNAFGDVHVTAGGSGIVKVKLRKVVYLASEAKARAFADRIELRLAGDGSPLRVGTNRDELSRGEDVGFETHLDLEVPAGTELQVRNEHGRVELAGVASADVRSSFDDVAIERIAGPVKVEAGHGAVRVSGVGQGLELRARHGDVELNDVKGTGRLELEHGGLTAHRTGPLDVALRYGDLDAESIGGDLVVRAVHARLDATDVAGHADVETSYGDVRLVRVGAARVKVEHGRISAEDVAGAVEAESTYNDVDLDRVTGPVEVSVDHGGASLRGLASGATVRAEGGDVVLEGFSGPVSVETERGSVRLVPRARVEAAISASARHGDVDLEVPDGSSVDIDAVSRRGEVHADVAGLSTTSSGRAGHGHQLAGELAGGGPVVRLRSDGDIRIVSAAVAPIVERPVSRATPAEAPVAPAAAGAKPRAAATAPSPGQADRKRP